MPTSSALARLLGLTINERRVLTALDRGPLSVSELVRWSRVPRMTVYTALRSLLRRGMAAKFRHGKRWLYDKKNNEAIFEPPSATSAAVTIHHGAQDILRSYKAAFSAHAQQRVHVIQSTASARAALRKSPRQLLAEANDGIKKHGIIVDVVVSPSILRLSGMQDTVWKKSMLGRATQVSLIRDALLDFSAEAWVFEDVILLTSWAKEVAISYRNPDMAALFRLLLESLKRGAKTFDSNAFLRKS